MHTLRSVLVVGWLLLGAAAAHAACPGDCSGDGAVTVNELVLGVNIAFGGAALDQCGSFDVNGDGAVTVNELIGAVNSALNGCNGSFAGDYSGRVTFDATYSGTINLTAQSNGQVAGSLLVESATALRAVGSVAGLSFTFPVGGVSVALTGSLVDPSSGGFEVMGSFVDAAGQTISVVISGNFPGPTGSADVNVYVGTDPPVSATLRAGMLGTPTPIPSPTPPPGNGPRIAYAGGAPSHIHVINVDGSGDTQITTSAGNDSNPAWSPDGTKIAFSTPDSENRHVGIAVVNADGSDLRLLFSDESFLDYFPAWSPDGSRIAFTAGGGDAIDVMNADGSGRHRLVTKSGGESFGHLSWSPDGSRIAVQSTRPRDSGHVREEIWVMNADGSNFVRLTNNEVEDNHPDWSPDGQTIVFGRAGVAGGVYRINPDGSGEKRLIFDPFAFGVSSPNWSRDGQQLAYQTLFGLKITDANGANAVTVPNTNFIADFDLQ
jgi:hypothetical protein